MNQCFDLASLSDDSGWTRIPFSTRNPSAANAHATHKWRPHWPTLTADILGSDSAGLWPIQHLRDVAPLFLVSKWKSIDILDIKESLGYLTGSPERAEAFLRKQCARDFRRQETLILKHEQRAEICAKHRWKFAPLNMVALLPPRLPPFLSWFHTNIASC